MSSLEHFYRTSYLSKIIEIFHELIVLIHISENNQIMSFNNISFFKNMLYSINIFENLEVTHYAGNGLLDFVYCVFTGTF